jgi:hypothetical protein
MQNLIKTHHLKVTNERVSNIRSTLQEIVALKNGVIPEDLEDPDDSITPQDMRSNNVSKLDSSLLSPRGLTSPFNLASPRLIVSPGSPKGIDLNLKFKEQKTLDFKVNFN